MWEKITRLHLKALFVEYEPCKKYTILRLLFHTILFNMLIVGNNFYESNCKAWCREHNKGTVSFISSSVNKDEESEVMVAVVVQHCRWW